MNSKKTSAKTASASPGIISCTHAMRSPCAVANGLEILGDRWTLLLVRDLMLTNRREFGHFLNSGEGISTNILSERLERLQASGIISKEAHPEHGKKFVYQLTERGLKLAPMMIEFALWAYQNIDGTFLPPHVHSLMLNDKNTLLKKIQKREILVKLNL